MCVCVPKQVHTPFPHSHCPMRRQFNTIGERSSRRNRKPIDWGLKRNQDTILNFRIGNQLTNDELAPRQDPGAWKRHYLEISTLASALNPAKASTTWSSKDTIFFSVLSSCSIFTDFLSTARTMAFGPLMPTTGEPLFTASWAYCTCRSWPSGENTVIALSYRAILS